MFRKSNAIPLLHIPQFHLIIDEVLPVVLVRNLAEVLLQVGLVNKSIEQGGLVTEFLLLILRTVPEDDFIQEGWQFGLNLDQIHYRLEHGFEVVLLRPPANEQFKLAVNFAFDIDPALDVLLVLQAVQVNI
jgi:hypothetical protein